MGDTLFGGERSGTPIETRAGTGTVGNLLLKQANQGSGAMGAESFANLFGISPTDLGIGDIIQQMLRSPADRTRGLFSSMEPFERRATSDAVSGVRSMFGTAGGRFSRNLGEAEAITRGELSNQFGRSRQEALLDAEGQRGNFLLSLFDMANRAGGTQMDVLSRFFAPGAPVHTEGLLPGLLAAGGNYLTGRMFANRPTGHDTLPAGGGYTGMSPTTGWNPWQVQRR